MPNLKPLLLGVLAEARSSKAEVGVLVDDPAVCRAPPRRLALPEVQGSSDQPPWPRDILEIKRAMPLLSEIARRYFFLRRL